MVKNYRWQKVRHEHGQSPYQRNKLTATAQTLQYWSEGTI